MNAATATHALRTENLTKSFGVHQALVELNLTVAAGEVVCLLGANGAGKTTTINLFLGFLQPDSGAALVDGIEVQRDPLAARKRLAYLPESVALYPSLSGLENLSFFDRLTGERARSTEELRALLKVTGLPEAAYDQRVSTYSKGMRQKVGIAIAMARRARGLLLDEPLSGLDPQAASTLGSLINQVRSNGCAVLMATHDIFRAKEIGNRIGIMKAGRLVDMIDASSLDAREIEQLYLHHMRERAATAPPESIA